MSSSQRAALEAAAAASASSDEEVETITVFTTANNPWQATEELLLLDAVEQYGFGNWEDVASHIKTKSSEEAEEHYNNMYILGNTGKATWPVDVRYKPKDSTCTEAGQLSPSLSARLSPLELTAQEQQELGYMPHRDDFEREFDNEAETLVCNLMVNQDDEDIDLALKLAHIDMYSRRLGERLRRKRIARELGLVPQFFLNSCNNKQAKLAKKKLSKEDREILDRLRVLGQFQTTDEHEKIFESLKREKELKARVKELTRYRRNGITKIKECEEFENARYKREKKKENKKKSGSGSSSHRRSTMVSKKQEEKNNSDNMNDDSGIGVNDVKEESKDVVDIAKLPGYDLLSERERKLCSSIGLKPAKYVTLKTVLIKDNLHKRRGVATKARYPAGLDKSHRRKIINFLVNNGWITSTC